MARKPKPEQPEQLERKAPELVKTELILAGRQIGTATCIGCRKTFDYPAKQAPTGFRRDYYAPSQCAHCQRAIQQNRIDALRRDIAKYEARIKILETYGLFPPE